MWFVKRSEFDALQQRTDEIVKALRQLQMWAVEMSERTKCPPPPVLNVGGSPPPPK